MRKFFLLIIPVLAMSCSFSREEVDLIVHNATIHSMDPSNTEFQAMAIKDGKLVELGAERSILNRYKSVNKIDALKKDIYPGFIDAHCHFLGYGRTINEIDLSNTNSFDEVLDLLSRKQSGVSSNWIIGRGWDQNDWENAEFPTKAKLDSMFSKNPVILTRVDGHTALVNQIALQLSGIDENTVVPGGQILKENGELTGVLIDNAMLMVKEGIFESSNSQSQSALLKAQEACFQVGLTTVSDAGLSVDEIKLIQQLQQKEDLKMRVYAMVSDKEANFDYFLENGPIKTDRLNVQSFKFYADGTLGSRSACLMRPYSDSKETSGYLLDSLRYFRMRAEQLYNAGFQMNTHCIGDSANRAILGLYAEFLQPQNDRRWRIEHAQVIAKQDRSMFSKFNIVPSVQPTHATSDMYWAELRLGRNRISRAYAYQSLKNELGWIALGTDFPVEGINPIHTFYAATVRKDENAYPKELSGGMKQRVG
ncbi:MAG: amidohydrolase, partial [Flavobacteriales bacterium]